MQLFNRANHREPRARSPIIIPQQKQKKRQNHGGHPNRRLGRSQNGQHKKTLLTRQAKHPWKALVAASSPGVSPTSYVEVRPRNKRKTSPCSGSVCIDNNLQYLPPLFFFLVSTNRRKRNETSTVSIKTRATRGRRCRRLLSQRARAQHLANTHRRTKRTKNEERRTKRMPPHETIPREPALRETNNERRTTSDERRATSDERSNR